MERDSPSTTKLHAMERGKPCTSTLHAIERETNSCPNYQWGKQDMP
jgi:hypothetical protein